MCNEYLFWVTHEVEGRVGAITLYRRKTGYPKWCHSTASIVPGTLVLCMATCGFCPQDAAMRLGLFISRWHRAVGKEGESNLGKFQPQTVSVWFPCLWEESTCLCWWTVSARDDLYLITCVINILLKSKRFAAEIVHAVHRWKVFCKLLWVRAGAAISCTLPPGYGSASAMERCYRRRNLGKRMIVWVS